MRALNRLMAGAGLALAFSIASGLEREARAQPQPQPVPAPPARERQLPPSARRQAETLAALRDIRARLDAVAGVDDLAALDADIARLVQTLKPPEPSGVAAVLSPYNDMLQIVTLLSTVSSLIGFGMQEPLTEFPRRSTVIRVEPIFDNQMTLCLNGEEVMTCHADLRDIEGRDNRVESRMGQHHLFDAKDEFEKILEKSEQRIKIMKTFEECIRAAASRPSLRNMSKRIDDILLRLPKP